MKLLGPREITLGTVMYTKFKTWYLSIQISALNLQVDTFRMEYYNVSYVTPRTLAWSTKSAQLKRHFSSAVKSQFTIAINRCFRFSVVSSLRMNTETHYIIYYPEDQIPRQKFCEQNPGWFSFLQKYFRFRPYPATRSRESRLSSSSNCFTVGAGLRRFALKPWIDTRTLKTSHRGCNKWTNKKR